MEKLITRLAHACFGTKDIEATRHFYSKILGFKVVHEFYNDSQELYGLLFSVGKETFIEFFLDHQENDLKSYFKHICFSVEDIEEVKKRLSDFGYDFQILRGRTDHTLQCWIIDPNGIKIEFHEYDEYSLLTKFQKE